ncbi:FAD-dependent thymidylate synthase [Candidatus Babeliales bacterium]|nr:FAD-dependent thymidylate synthase [Candidatus Babeliales bacterium]
MQEQKNVAKQSGAIWTEQENKIDPLGDGISSIELVRASGTDLDIANAARVSYGRLSHEVSERDEKLINFLMEHNHSSPFEHNQLSFRIKCPLFIARQWMRHRMHSYNEISYRYVKVKTEFYIPKEWRLQDKENGQSSFGGFKDEDMTKAYKASIDAAYEQYNKMLEAGVCREQARAILPVATYTEFIFTTNLRSLLHFMELRLGHGAQQEIREYAKGLLQLSMPHFPISLKAWQKFHLKGEEWEDQLAEWTTQLGDK